MIPLVEAQKSEQKGPEIYYTVNFVALNLHTSYIFILTLWYCEYIQQASCLQRMIFLWYFRWDTLLQADVRVHSDIGIFRTLCFHGTFTFGFEPETPR